MQLINTKLHVVNPEPAPGTKRTGATKGLGRKRHRSQIHNGQRRAALQALTAARAYLAKLPWAPTIAVAAECCGSNPVYVRAAIILIKAEDGHALELVLRGNWPLLETAARLEARAKCISTLRETPLSDLPAVTRAVGVDFVWDRMISPTL